MKIYASALAICAACLPASAMAQEISVTGSASVSEGNYGSARETTMGVFAGGAIWRSGGTSIQVTVPYVVVESPGVVFAGFDGTPLVMVPDLGGPKRNWDGFGDPTLSVSQTVAAGGFDLRGTGRVKLAVQDINEVSTGETDFSLSGEVSRNFGSLTPFVGAGYRWYGDPDLWDIKDGWSASAGVALPIANGSAAFSYEFAEATSDFVGDSHELVGVYDAPLTQSGLRLAAFGTVGLSSGAPDYGVGVRLAKSF